MVAAAEAGAPTEPVAMAVEQSAPHIALGDGPEAEPPASFEVRQCLALMGLDVLTKCSYSSILSMMSDGN